MCSCPQSTCREGSVNVNPSTHAWMRGKCQHGRRRGIEREQQMWGEESETEETRGEKVGGGRNVAWRRKRRQHSWSGEGTRSPLLSTYQWFIISTGFSFLLVRLSCTPPSLSSTLPLTRSSSRLIDQYDTLKVSRAPFWPEAPLSMLRVPVSATSSSHSLSLQKSTLFPASSLGL